VNQLNHVMYTNFTYIS